MTQAKRSYLPAFHQLPHLSPDKSAQAQERHDPSTSGKSTRFGHPVDKKVLGRPMEGISADSFRIARHSLRKGKRWIEYSQLGRSSSYCNFAYSALACL